MGDVLSGGATLQGVNVTHAEIHVPASGLWHLDVALQDSTELTGPLSFVFQSLTLTCAAVRSINYANSRGLRLVAGAGGWRQTIGPRQYASPQAVMLSTVIGDAAQAVGEATPVLASDVQLGTAYVRSQGPAVRVLDLLPLWWADFTGTVQSKARDVSAISSVFTLMNVDKSAGKAEIATNDLQDWTPGRTFSTPALSGTINRVMHVIDHTQVRTYAFLPNLVAGEAVGS